MSYPVFIYLFIHKPLFEISNVFPEALADMSMGLVFGPCTIGNASSVELNMHITNLAEPLSSA